MFRIMSFNTNGIRARPHQLAAIRDKYDPDVIGIQETKVQDPDFPIEMINDLGYQVTFFGQKAHYGVALLSKEEPKDIIRGFPNEDEDAQRRLIGASYPLDGRMVHVLNGYFPQGESREHPTKFPNKRKYYADLHEYLSANYSEQDAVIVMGDVNVAPADIDIGIGPDNAKRWLKNGKCSFLPEEREWLSKISGLGYTDSYRKHYSDVNDKFSWFDYRSRGFDREPKRGLRIDLIMSSPILTEVCTDSGIAYDIRGMEKPSDHCPIWSDFQF